MSNWVAACGLILGSFHAGMDAWEAARDIALNGFGTWGEFGRIGVNVDTVYRTLDPTHHSPNIVEQFQHMAALERVPGD